jgi:glutamyl-tRNA reductase
MIGLVSINYKNAPIEIREKFDFSDNQKDEFYKIIKSKRIVEGVMIISTCNRTEIYFENEKFTGLETKIIHKVLKELVDYKSFFDSLSLFVETKTSKYVTEHLFRLVSGLESMIIGEYQIVDQIKQSFAFAKENDMLSPILERMIQKSFEAGKYIRSNTHIGKGAVSISYAIVEKLSKLPQINSSKILVVGAGETSLLTIKHLLKKQIENISVVNRSSDKAKAIAKKCNINYDNFNDLPKLLVENDVAIFSTSSKKSLISFEEITNILKLRNDKNIILIDLSVPRNLPASLSNINGVSLINIDNLKDQVNKNYKKRKLEIAKAEGFIHFFLNDFNQWKTSRHLRPSIVALNDQFDDLLNSDEEKCSCCNKLLINCINFSNQHNRIRTKFLNNLIKKIKLVSNNGKDEDALNVINKIFSYNE